MLQSPAFYGGQDWMQAGQPCIRSQVCDDWYVGRAVRWTTSRRGSTRRSTGTCGSGDGSWRRSGAAKRPGALRSAPLPRRATLPYSSLHKAICSMLTFTQTLALQLKTVTFWPLHMHAKSGNFCKPFTCVWRGVLRRNTCASVMTERQGDSL